LRKHSNTRRGSTEGLASSSLGSERPLRSAADSVTTRPLTVRLRRCIAASSRRTRDRRPVDCARVAVYRDWVCRQGHRGGVAGPALGRSPSVQPRSPSRRHSSRLIGVTRETTDMHPRLILSGAGIAGACAVVWCSVPLLAVVASGLALLIGSYAEAVEVGVIATVIVGVMGLVGTLILRRRRGGCSCASGCSCSSPSRKQSLSTQAQRPGGTELRVIYQGSGASASAGHPG
jgi:hypothetical protein